jgi:hypothetical protein
MSGFFIGGAAGSSRPGGAPAAGEVVAGYPVSWIKAGTVPEAAGVDYLFAKDTGTPGAWAPGTPGVAGRTCDGTTAADAGCLPVRTPPSGSAYLLRYEQGGSLGHRAYLVDKLWVNSGLVVTTTTAQTVGSVAFPARDLFGGTAGVGVRLGIYVSAATTNASAVTTITASYTSSDGVPGRTATIASFPATCVAGSIVYFRLQAGDEGVRSVESVTLGTTLGGGTIHLVALVELVATPAIAAFIGDSAPAALGSLGVRLYPGACLSPACVPSAATALTVYGSIFVQEVT